MCARVCCYTHRMNREKGKEKLRDQGAAFETLYICVVLQMQTYRSKTSTCVHYVLIILWPPRENDRAVHHPHAHMDDFLVKKNFVLKLQM